MNENTRKASLDEELKQLIAETSLEDVLSVLAMQQEGNLRDLIFATVRYLRDKNREKF